MLAKECTLKLNDSYNLKDVLRIIVYLSGVFVTMPIVGISLGGHFLSLFSILFILLFAGSAFLAVNGGSLPRILKNKVEICFFGFCLWSLVGIALGLYFLNPSWKPYLISNGVKPIEYILLMLLIHIVNDGKSAEQFAKGLMLGFILNCSWSILQGVYYLVFHHSLNSLLFSNASIDVAEIWTVYGGIRACGFNMDPANIGGFLPAVVFYALYHKKKYLLVICALSLVFSQSTTALVGTFFAVAVYVVFHRKYIGEKKVHKKHSNSMKRLSIYFLAAAGVIAVFIVLLKNGTIDKLVDGISSYVDGFVTRVSSNYVYADDKGPRAIYYGQAIPQLFKRNILFMLCGSGIGTSMEAYAEYQIFGIVGVNAFGEVETTFLAYLFDCGIIGFFIYVLLLYYAVRALLKSFNKMISETGLIYFSFLIAMIFSELLYHYIFTAYRMMALIFLIDYLNNYDNSVIKYQVKKLAGEIGLKVRGL